MEVICVFKHLILFGKVEFLDGIQNVLLPLKYKINNNLKEFYKTYEILRVRERGYPDLLKYEGDDTSTIISWWNVTVKNKKSGKTKEAVHHSQIVVNSDGKIVNEQYYFNASALPN